MQYDFGYSEDDKLGKPYDIKMMTRLYPFVKPHWRLLAAAVVLIILITLFELAIPYLTKISIDRYIAPKADWKPEAKTNQLQTRYYSVGIDNPEIQRIVESYPELFFIQDNHAVISYDDLIKLTPDDLAKVRKKDLTGIVVITTFFVVIILLDLLSNFSQVMMMEFMGQRIMHDLRMALYSHIQNLSVSFFSKQPLGRLVTRVTNDIQNMYELFTSVIVFIFKDMFLLVGIMAALVVMKWKLALVSFSVLPLVVMASVYFSNRARDAFRELRVKIAEINSRLSETIGGIKVIQLYLQELPNFLRFKELNHDYYLSGMRQIHVIAIFLPVIEFFGHTAIAMVILYGGGSVLKGQISLGELVAFMSYMKMFFRPIRDLAEKYNVMQNAMASAERIFLLMDKKESVPEPACETDAPGITQIQEVVLDNVSFSYGTSDWVLQNISFKLRAGDTIALVGPTGSGKTSLINLLVRFYDPSSGQVLINGKDIKTVPSSSFRRRMALVPQDPFLFSGTVRNNIFGSQQMLPEEEEKILLASNCKPIIETLPKGLDMELGEGGASISSGERQLISIARAFARNPDLIILDEATSYIDTETEVKIQKAIENLMTNRTSIIVAHRLSTARKANTIYVLKRGRIIESGHHDHLMSLKGFYYRLNQIEG